MCPYRCNAGMVGLAVLLVLSFVPNKSQADDKPTGKAKTASEFVRMVYPVHGGLAKELAQALMPHFRQSSFLALPAAGNKNLILSGPKGDVQEAFRLLQELDRPAQTIRVDVFLVEMTGKGAGSTELSGAMGKVVAKLHELEQQGMVASVERIEVSVLEGETAKCLIGGYKPYVTGVTRLAGSGPFESGGFGGRGGAGFGPFGGGGRKGATGKGTSGKGSSKGEGAPGSSAPGTGGAPGSSAPGAGGAPGDDGAERMGPRTAAMARTVNYRNLGTQVQIIKPAIAADGLVDLQIQIEDSKPRKASGGVDLFSDESGAGVPATEFTNFTLEDRLRIPRGNIVTAQTTQTTSRNNQGQTLILVGVRVD